MKTICTCKREDDIKNERTIENGFCSYCGWPIEQESKTKSREELLDIAKLWHKKRYPNLNPIGFAEDLTDMVDFALEFGQFEQEKRFTKPTDKDLVGIAVLFNDGKIHGKQNETKLRDMIAMADFIIDRLYENGDVTKPSSKEK